MINNPFFNVSYASTASLTPVSSNGYTLTSTSGSPSALVIDGATPANSSYVLLQNQTDNTQNGLYQVIDNGLTGDLYVLQRTGLCAVMMQNMTIYCVNGVVNGGVFFTLTTAGLITPGSSALTFVPAAVNSTNVTSNTVQYTTSGSITEVSGVVMLNGTGALTMTLASPPTSANGQTLTIMNQTAFASTISQSSPGFNGTTHTCSFSGNVSDNIVLYGFGGIWYVKALKNATLS